METIPRLPPRPKLQRIPRLPPKLCVECNHKGRLVKRLNIIVCIECNKLDKYTLITKTNAKLKYFLTEDDLDDDNLTYYEGSIGYGPATYFTIYDIKNKICQKHNVILSECDNLIKKLINDKETRKGERRIKGKEKIILQRTKRQDILVNALRAAGLDLRTDSQLCSKYISGGFEKTKNNSNSNSNSNTNIVEQIVKRMCQMKYLYDYCHMEECKDKIYEERNKYGSSEYDDFSSISDDAELMALDKYSHSKYPIIFPWQVNQSL